MTTYPPSVMARVGKYVVDKTALDNKIAILVQNQIRFECIPWTIVGLWDLRVLGKDMERVLSLPGMV